MKTKTIKGTLTSLERLPSSINGNPRYMAVIGGEIYRTQPDAALGYAISNYKGYKVVARVGIWRGKWHVDRIEKA